MTSQLMNMYLDLYKQFNFETWVVTVSSYGCDRLTYTEAMCEFIIL